MGSLDDICYTIIIFFIRFYKMVQSNIFKLFVNQTKNSVEKGFLQKDILINGTRPWDITVKNQKFYNTLATYGEDGFVQSFIDGWWDTEDLEQLLTKTVTTTSGKRKAKLSFSNRIDKLFHYLEIDLFNHQTKERAFEVGEQHYDLGNDLYSAMLGPSMQYSCGYWLRANNLDEAQTAKMELVARKLKLKPGMRVLDIGGGWMTFALYLAKHYEVEVVAITISKEQAKYGIERAGNLKVDIRVQDYREINEKFDRICSIGMMEHVGRKNYRNFFEVVNRCLVDDGIFLCHTIGSNSRKIPSTSKFINKYIFPNGRIPYYKEVADASEDLFIIEDWHNFGYDYSLTLQCWWDNFEKAWPQLEAKYGQKFYRIWKMYIFNSKKVFRYRKYQLWQITFSKKGLEEGYVYAR